MSLTTSTDAAPAAPEPEPAPPHPVRPGRPARGWALFAGAALIMVWFGIRVESLGAAALNDDLGIQWYLGRITGEGAIPLVDFEHGWNTATWYWNAGLHLAAGDNPTLWTFWWAWGTGAILAGLLALVVAARLRLEGTWVAGLVAAWLLLTHVPHHKYAVPIAWCLVLLPVGLGRRDGVATALRVGLPATVWWFHVELAILLAVGTAMFDLLGDRGVGLWQRIGRVAALVAGLAVGCASQVGVYALLGLEPTEVLRQILVGQTGTFEIHFGYPLDAPQSVRVLLYPATLVLPFLPAVWRRLSTSTRFVALLHLSLALIPIRRPGDGHAAAAATLLALLAVLALRDLSRAPPPRWSRNPFVALVGILVGAVWFTTAILTGFRVESLLAIIGLTVVCLVGVAVAWRWDVPWTAAGAVAAAGILILGGFAGRFAQQVAGDNGNAQAPAIAAEVQDEVDACLGPEREAWIVPSPLPLYDALDVTNPTPWYLFWYHFEGDLPAVREQIAEGEIPIIITAYGWPESMGPIVDEIESTYARCAEVLVEGTGNLITVWRYPGA